MIAFALLLALEPDSLPRVARGEATPQLHYRCEVQRRTESGNFGVTRIVDKAGLLISTSALWSAPHGPMPELGAGWVVAQGQELDLTRGYLHFDIRDATGVGNLKGRFTLELSTTASVRSFGATLKGRALRLSYLRRAFPDLAVDWADGLALARGASRLFLNARDKGGRLLHSWNVDRQLLATAETEVAAMQDAAIAMSEQAATQCQAFDPAEQAMVIAT